jgi:hypothetical protein
MIDGKRVVYYYCNKEKKSTLHTWKQVKTNSNEWVVTYTCTSCNSERKVTEDHERVEDSYMGYAYNYNGVLYDAKLHMCKCDICELDITLLDRSTLCPKCADKGLQNYLDVILYENGNVRGHECPVCKYKTSTGGSGGGGGGSISGGGSDGDSGEGGDNQDPADPNKPTDPDNPDNPNEGGSSGDGDGDGEGGSSGGDHPPLHCEPPNTTTNIITGGITNDSGGSGGGGEEGDEPIPPIAITPSNTAGMGGYPHLILGCKDNSSDWYTFKERDLYVNYQAPIYPFGLSFFNEIDETKYPISICYIQEVVNGGSTTYQYSDILVFEQPPVIF